MKIKYVDEGKTAMNIMRKNCLYGVSRSRRRLIEYVKLNLNYIWHPGDGHEFNNWFVSADWSYTLD